MCENNKSLSAYENASNAFPEVNWDVLREFYEQPGQIVSHAGIELEKDPFVKEFVSTCVLNRNLDFGKLKDFFIRLGQYEDLILRENRSQKSAVIEYLYAQLFCGQGPCGDRDSALRESFFFPEIFFEDKEDRSWKKEFKTEIEEILRNQRLLNIDQSSERALFLLFRKRVSQEVLSVIARDSEVVQRTLSGFREKVKNGLSFFSVTLSSDLEETDGSFLVAENVVSFCDEYNRINEAESVPDPGMI